MTAVVLAVSGLMLAASTGQWRARRLWSRLLAAAVLGLVVAAPAYLPYMRVQQAEGFGRTMYEAANHSASWRSYAQVPPANLLYGRTGVLAPRPPAAGERDRRSVEHQLFPGLVLLILAAAGAATGVARDARPLVFSSLALVTVGVALSFGPEGARAAYAALHDNIAGFQAIRAPARFAVIAVLGLGLLAALGTRAVLATRPGRALPMLLAALLALEYVNGPLPLAPAPARRTGVGQWLAAEPGPGAVLYVPLGDDIGNTPVMVQSLEHRRPIVNGYSGQRPAFFSALVESLADFPAPDALAAVRELDVRFVVAPAPVAGAGDPRSPLVERARFAEGVIYEVRWTPVAVAALGDTSGPPPPPPGIAPFAAGERAVYEVYWEGGPVNLPAGTAVVRVLDGAADRGYTFETVAETASWVSSFFEARDRFTTRSDAVLRPLEHQREIREGRRRLSRTFVYDQAAGAVRIGESRTAAVAADALTLPLGSDDARDALTALFYVRTLALAPGTIVSVPINEAGTRLVLQVAAAGHETIEQAGRAAPALRLEPRLMRRIERRRPIAMTLWLSADERRLPLRVVVRAGFGEVRAELVEYRAAVP